MMRYIIALITLSLSLLSAPLVQAQINVSATTSSMAMLVREVGGEAVSVTELAPPDRDAHFLVARPSIMAALRRADLLVAVGAELEIGWLPAAIQGANNRNVYPGQRGYFEAAAHIELLEVGGPADRSLGDVHPDGNPHFHLDPVRMGQIALALAEHLAGFEPARGDYFRSNAERFVAMVEERLPQWRERAAGVPGILEYHDDVIYLAELLDVPVHGAIEPLPGIPPSARHLRDLVTQMQGRQGVIIYMLYQPERGPRFMAEQLGWPLVRLSLEPPLGATAEDYFSLLDSWIDAFNTTG